MLMPEGLTCAYAEAARQTQSTRGMPVAAAFEYHTDARFMFRSSCVICPEFYVQAVSKKVPCSIVIAPVTTAIEYPALAGAVTGQDAHQDDAVVCGMPDCAGPTRSFRT
jgi:hypothetical protein